MFFSVKVPMLIGGKQYKTCICYPLTEGLKKTVEGLVAKGKAEVYEEQRFFCNGKLVELKKKSKAKKTAKKETAEVTAETETTDETEGF